MKRAILIAVCAALTLSACGSGGGAVSSRTSQGRDEVTVAKAAAFPTGFETGKVGAILTNQSQQRAATNVTVEATAYMDQTEVGDSIPESVGVIHPRQSLPVAMDMTLNLAPRCGPAAKRCPITRVLFHASVGAWLNDTDSKREITGSNITFTQLPTSSDGFDQFTLRAQVANGYPRKLENVQVSAVCKSHDGTVVSFGRGQVDLLPADGKATATLGMSGEAPGSASGCQVVGWPTSPGQVGLGGATPEPTPAGGDLSIGTVGFGGDEPTSSYDGNPSAGVVLTNGSKAFLAEQVTVAWTAYNSGGQVLDSNSTDIAVIRAGQALPVVSEFSGVNTTDIASVKVQTLVHSWRNDTNPKGVITGQENTTIVPGYTSGIWDIAGELKNGYTSNLEYVTTYIYCTDASGNFVAGHVTYARLLPASATGSVSSTVYSTTKPASCEMNAVPSTIPPD